MTALSNLTAKEVGDVVITYEPAWAISNGRDFEHHEMPKPGQVKTAIDYIRSYITDVFGPKASKRLRVLYGASVHPEMIHGFLDVEGVDGFLVGGASLNYQTFADIVAAAHRWQRDRGEL